MSKAQAKDAVAALVAKFQYNLADYKRVSYNETLTRIDFINPFFEALGWDMTNHQGLPENLREVIHEDKLDIKGRKKAPDYSFRLPNGRVERKFFLEANNPADKQLYQRQIAATDKAIDRLVYALYELSEAEIKIVEESRA
ncbi:MAG: hypothetical protein BroJett011_30480 [Chloroflexota bacterium]|nr:MAG: hypothetical protein BroJett011_30480 [Chloroflexota bacterium]